MKTLGEIYTRNAKLYPNKEGIVYEGRKLTYQELNLRVNRLISALAAKGINKGDRVAILSKNCPEYMEAYGLAEKGGIILVPLNWRMIARELNYMLADSGTKALIVSQEYISTIDSIRNQLPDLEIYISLESPAQGYEFYEDILNLGSLDEPNVEIDPDDVAYIIYSSGTTGLPKGIMLTHKGQMDNAIAQLVDFRSGEHHVNLTVVPLFHSGGYGVTLSHFYRGCKLVIMREYNSQKVLETIQREKVNVLYFVPTMVAFLLDYSDIDQYDTSSLETIFYAGSPMPLGLLKRAIDKFGPIFCQGYGLTEAGPTTTFLSQADHVTEGEPKLTHRLNSCGKQAIACEVRVVNENGEDVKPDEVGEVIIKSQRLMKGYWNQPEKTAATIRNGWLYSSDMATVDEDGYIYIVDRKNDMIISGGENIYPREIEEVLYSHPAVLEASIIGVPDDKWGEAIKAYIALKQDAVASEHEIIEFCKQNLASFKKPKFVEFMTELPKNASGKILKTVLRDKHWSGRDKKV